MLVLGLMSGTSADGVDAVLTNFDGCLTQPNWRIVNHKFFAYPKKLQQLIIQAGQGYRYTSLEWLELAEEITNIHALAAKACDPKRSAKIVGCHGQTLWHEPPTDKSLGKSLQLIQAPLLAQILKQPVIYDFRAADLALGGQGAPLVPMADAALIRQGEGWQAIVNLGGISNITLLPPKKGPDKNSSIQGWDCGPANSLIDLAIQKLTKGELSFDKDGLIAKSGTVNEKIIKKWLQEPFFNATPPKSTGRERFGLKDLHRRLNDISHLSASSQIATITAFSAAIIAQDIEYLANRNLARPIAIFVSGGGQKNIKLMQELKKRCLGTRVTTLEDKGISIESREALAFGLLAWWHFHQHPGNNPSITGASDLAVLGTKVEPNSNSNSNSNS